MRLQEFFGCELLGERVLFSSEQSQSSSGNELSLTYAVKMSGINLLYYINIPRGKITHSSVLNMKCTRFLLLIILNTHRQGFDYLNQSFVLREFTIRFLQGAIFCTQF